MRSRSSRILAGAVVAVGAAVAQPVFAAGAGAATTTPTVAISGASSRATTFGTTVGIAGTAPAGSSVGVFFHKAGTPGYTQRRTVTASSSGMWSTSYLAGDDYRIYATSGTSRSSTILVQVAPTISGAVSLTVKKGSTYTITGTAIPGNTLTVHFHKAGTAPNDYSILRTVTVTNNGTWARPYVAATDYRFFASLPNGQVSQTVLVQAR